MSETNPYASNEPMSPDAEKAWATAAHLLAIPFEFFAPLIGYLVFNGKGPFISHHVRESLNFGITMLLTVVVLAISIIGIALIWLPPIIWTVLRIVAALKTSQGEFYKYPLTYRFIKN
ncbi:MAG: DUF4870 domain-containing protein [Actinomycetota bacterium]